MFKSKSNPVNTGSFFIIIILKHLLLKTFELQIESAIKIQQESKQEIGNCIENLYLKVHYRLVLFLSHFSAHSG